MFVKFCTGYFADSSNYNCSGSAGFLCAGICPSEKFGFYLFLVCIHNVSSGNFGNYSGISDFSAGTAHRYASGVGVVIQRVRGTPDGMACDELFS